MIARAVFRHLHRDRRGATIVEFALVLLPLMMVIIGGFDLGYRMYISAVAQGAVRDAARLGTTGATAGTAIDAHVKSVLSSVVSPSAVTITKKSYLNFANVRQPERITSDRAPFGRNDGEDCFEDANGNGVWDSDGGKEGLGGSDDIVSYHVQVAYKPFFPVEKLLHWAGLETIDVFTVMRNQPFATQAGAQTVCP
ncbi:TadE/TadG family type IV pilus assembly protein [Hephaestia sp. GCM10023244]|uniref:TadE/TadG family type IV pilus assembly protein n=1 Tax=unclassified Hephaestia TaxID=2631281 RepID=UPI0020774D86|nr:TadE/TadG family type IV pilus assembly protein [Hephaestia sp. MAHUQ-44]MCM8730011.1 pilus assembly protein [Hephaestia sp. MAHUQ-44]